MNFTFSERRAFELGRKLSRYKHLYKIFLEADPQYGSVKTIIDRLGFIDGSLYIVGVALVSYMLSMKGEEHWRLAASYAARFGLQRGLKAFVNESPSLRRYRAYKQERIERYFSNTMPKLRIKLAENPISVDQVARIIASTLRTKPESKTVVFSAKMLIYACYYSGKTVADWENIPIPVDHRVALATLTSGLARAHDTKYSLPKLANILRDRHADRLREIWMIVSRESGIPPLMIDNIIWVSARCIEEHIHSTQQIERCVLSIVKDRRALSVLRELWRTLQ